MINVINKRIRFAQVVALVLFLILLANVTPTGDFSQDLTFRLMNIERRLDQLQTRVDIIERAQQNQSMSSNTATSSMTTAAVLELQRMQLSLAEQVVQLQKKTLELEKTIDQLSNRETKQEKKEPSKDEPKTKAKQVKP